MVRQAVAPYVCHECSRGRRGSQILPARDHPEEYPSDYIDAPLTLNSSQYSAKLANQFLFSQMEESRRIQEDVKFSVVEVPTISETKERSSL